MNKHLTRQSGFTLIELMVTVAIIGILGAIAVPMYISHVVHANRAAARACMTEAGQYMERWYTTGNGAGALTYVAAALGLNCQTDGGLNTRYTMTLDTLAQNTYRIVATPIGSQLTKDTGCGTLTLNQAGVRTSSGTWPLSDCWSR